VTASVRRRPKKGPKPARPVGPLYISANVQSLIFEQNYVVSCCLKFVYIPRFLNVKISYFQIKANNVTNEDQNVIINPVRSVSDAACVSKHNR